MSKTNHNNAGRREFLLASAAATLGFAYHGISGIKAGDSMTNHHAGLADLPTTHGMLIFGEKTAYLSHRPLFGTTTPHRYQVILEVTLAQAGRDPQADFVQDRRKHPGTKFYTFEPEPFVLPDLNPANQLRRSFKGNIVRGDFEKKDSFAINRDVTASITRVIHFREFDPAAAGLPQLEYFLFGKSQELYLAHLITKPPDFDQIVPVAKIDQPFTDEALGQGVPITFPGTLNKLAKRIKASPQVIGQMKKADGSPGQVKLQTKAELYFETGDLAE
jgi:hypothetical protein